MLIKPAWIDSLKGSSADETLKMKCKGGDPFDFLMELVIEKILELTGDAMNWFINRINDIM